MKTTSKYVLGGVAILVAIAATAVASSYITRESLEPEKKPVQTAKPTNTQRYAATQPAAGKPPCEDHNIVGTVGGAVAGGLVGSQFGKGSGKGIATAGGAVAGGALGNAFIPTRGATCE